MTPVSELCDVYTETGQPIGRTVPRSEIDTALTADEYVKSVLVLVHTPDGRFLVTRRSAEKRWGAGMWELPGGGVQAGETGAEAAARELAEETGLAVSPGEARLLLAYHREYHYLVEVFGFRRSVSPAEVRLEQGETIDFRLGSAAEVRDLCKKDGFLHYDSIKSVFLLTDSAEK